MQVGVLYSENKEVVGMVSKMAHTSQASSDTMDLVGQLFREPGFLDDYFRQHQASKPPVGPPTGNDIQVVTILTWRLFQDGIRPTSRRSVHPQAMSEW